MAEHWGSHEKVKVGDMEAVEIAPPVWVRFTGRGHGVVLYTHTGNNKSKTPKDIEDTMLYVKGSYDTEGHSQCAPFFLPLGSSFLIPVKRSPPMHSRPTLFLLLLLLLSSLMVQSFRFIPPLGNGCRGTTSSHPSTLEADRICDPDSLLSDLRPIQKALQKISTQVPHQCGRGTTEKGAELAILVVRHLGPNEAVSSLAKQAHDRWGMGHKACEDGAVLVLAMEDREFFLSTGKGMKGVLTDQSVTIITDRMKPHLRAGDLTRALEEATMDILAVLQARYHTTRGEGGGATGRAHLPDGHDAPRAALIISQSEDLLVKETAEFRMQVAFYAAFACFLGYFFIYPAYLDLKKKAAEAAAEAAITQRLRAVQRARVQAEAAGADDPTPLGAR